MAEFRFGEQVLNNVQMPLKLAAGRLALKPLTATHAGGTLTMNLGVDAAGAVPKLDLDMTLAQFELGKVPAVQRKKTLEGGRPSDLTIKATGRGDSIAAVMGGNAVRVLAAALPATPATPTTPATRRGSPATIG